MMLMCINIYDSCHDRQERHNMIIWATIKQPYRHREDKTTNKWASILDTNEHRHRQHNKELLNMPWILTDTAKIKTW